MYRLVVDTNVVVRVAIGTGSPQRLWLEALLGGKCTLVTSGEIIGEIRKVLGRPKFRLDESQINMVMSEIESLSEVIETKSRFSVVKRDPDDDMLINAAYDGRADYIVSGDLDLLDLKEFRGIKVVTAAQMLGILQSDG